MAKLTEFEDIIAVVLKHEGGFVDDPDDRGGATNWGVTQKVYETFREEKCTVDDIKNILGIQCNRCELTTGLDGITLVKWN